MSKLQEDWNKLTAILLGNTSARVLSSKLTPTEVICNPQRFNISIHVYFKDRLTKEYTSFFISGLTGGVPVNIDSTEAGALCHWLVNECSDAYVFKYLNSLGELTGHYVLLRSTIECISTTIWYTD